MDWKAEEVNEVEKEQTRGQMSLTPARDILRRMMTRAVELAAARGGTMTAEQLHEAEQRSDHGCDPRLFWHISALGARNAVLEVERDVALKERDLARDDLATEIADGKRLASEIAEVRERWHNEQEANRELVRRAQQAEAQAEKDRQGVEAWRRRLNEAAEELADAGAGEVGRLDIVTRVRMLKARCAALSAAGQVLSEHVDKACDSHMWVAAGADGARACIRCPVLRYPCSPTCTHDDAATPGHPERVKERSEAVNNITTLEATAYECGAEAMRAACLEAVQAVLEKNGLITGYIDREVKSAIEGAVP